MIARCLISPSLEARVEEIGKILSQHELKQNHPDVLYVDSTSKLGIEQARIIKAHFSLKPYQAKGRAVVLEDAANLTVEAQNALLKILEEPPAEALIILGAPSDAKFLPTILSRCEIITLDLTGDNTLEYHNKYTEDLKKLLPATIEERFEYIEKLKDRGEFLHFMVYYFQQNLASHMSSGNTEFLKELLQAEQWAKQNVNIRAILEYLMLVMPSQS